VITLIGVEGYRCLKHAYQPLGGFHILVGPNASGKSVFLDTLAFLRDVLQEGPEAAVMKRGQSLRELVWQQGADAFELAVEIAIPKALQTRLPEPYPFCRYEVRVGSGPEGRVQLLAENFWLLRVSPTPAADQDKSHQSMVHEQPPTGGRQVIRFRGGGLAYFYPETASRHFSMVLPLQVASLTALSGAEQFPVATWARAVLTRGVRLIKLGGFAIRHYCPPDAPRVLQPDGSNLAAVVRYLREQDPNEFQQWLQHIQWLLPGLQDVDVQVRGEDRYLYLVARAGGVTSSQLLSDGVLRMMALTILPYLPMESLAEERAFQEKIPPIYLIEEPENGIYPTHIEGVFQSLSSVYDGQVLVATHSPLFVNLAKPEQILCFVQTKKGTQILSGDQHPLLQNWQGVPSLGELYAAGALG
jgi:predicted ATPase